MRDLDELIDDPWDSSDLCLWSLDAPRLSTFELDLCEPLLRRDDDFLLEDDDLLEDADFEAADLRDLLL